MQPRTAQAFSQIVRNAFTQLSVELSDSDVCVRKRDGWIFEELEPHSEGAGGRLASFPFLLSSPIMPSGAA